MSRREISDSKSSAALSMVAAVVLAFSSAAHAKGEGEAVAMLDAEQLQKVVTEAHAQFNGVKDGKNADYIPILATIPSELFGVVIATRDGTLYSAGDVDYRFAIESVSKPFTAALVMQQYGGPEIIPEKIGVEPTGLPFNSKMALEIYKAPLGQPAGQRRRDRRGEPRQGEQREGALGEGPDQPRGTSPAAPICRSSRRCSNPSTRRR